VEYEGCVGEIRNSKIFGLETLNEDIFLEISWFRDKGVITQWDCLKRKLDQLSACQFLREVPVPWSHLF
jgi:hypothetical protein